MLRSLLVLVLIAAGCGQPSDPRVAPPDEPATPTAAPRPATMERSVFVEGQPQIETLTLRDFPDFPVPFSTYTRPGISVEQPGSGDAVAFEVGDLGLASILVNVVQDGATAQATVDRLRGGVADAVELDAGWARGAFAFVDGDTATEVYVAEHDGGIVTIEAAAPAEMGDGFAPTVRLILDQWRWADGSTLL